MTPFIACLTAGLATRLEQLEALSRISQLSPAELEEFAWLIKALQTAPGTGKPVNANTVSSGVGESTDHLVTARSLAHQLSLPVSSLYELARGGRIPCIRVGKHVRFSPPAVLKALEATDAVSRAHR